MRVEEDCCFCLGQYPRMMPPADRTMRGATRQLSLFARGPLFAAGAASGLFVLAVYHAFRYVVFGAYDTRKKSYRYSRNYLMPRFDI